jgi:hypothetical protein
MKGIQNSSEDNRTEIAKIERLRIQYIIACITLSESPSRKTETTPTPTALEIAKIVVLALEISGL